MNEQMDFWEVMSEIIQRREVLTLIKDDVLKIISENEVGIDILDKLDYKMLQTLIKDELKKKIGDDFGNNFRFTVLEGTGEIEETLIEWHKNVAKAAVKAIKNVKGKEQTK